MLTPFSIKDGMILAGPSRLPLQDTSKFDQLLKDQDVSCNYLKTCRSSLVKKKWKSTSETTDMPMEVDIDYCPAWDATSKQKDRKFKLLQFEENHRPAYYGSWITPRGQINPRNPFKKDIVSENVCIILNMMVVWHAIVPD